MRTQRFLLLLWVLGLCAVVVVIPRASVLAAPAPWELSAWVTWMTWRPVDQTVFAVLRLLVLAAAWYLLAVTVVGVGARVGRTARLMTVADLVTVPAVRGLINRGLGIGLATASLVAVGPIASLGPRPAVAAIAAEPSTPERLPVDGPAYLPPAPSRGAVALLAPADAAPAASEPSGERGTPVAKSTWTVRPGDHLWSIATRVLERAGQAAGEREISRYWQRLIETNRKALADPGNPDLIYPGQVLTLPPLGS